MYKVNDVVVYHRDVCKVVGKHRSDFTGEPCYILVPYFKQDGSVRMQVPVSNKAGHLRDIISKEEILELIEDTPNLELLENKAANMKSLYSALMKTDKVSDLVRIIKTSWMRNQIRMEQNKKLAAVDDEYLRKAEKYLYDEISAALGISFDESKQYFEGEVLRRLQS